MLGLGWTVWFVGRQTRRLLMCGLICAADAVSLAVTGIVHETVLQRTPGALEAAALLGIWTLACRYLRSWQVPVVGLLQLATLLTMQARLGTAAANDRIMGAYPLLVLLLMTAAGGFGLYLRSEDNRQVAAAEQIRRSERLELARDRHDHVAHYVTGIVVLAEAGKMQVETNPAIGRELFTTIERTGREGLVAMSRMVRLLRRQ